METITWTAVDNSAFTVGSRHEKAGIGKTLRGAVRVARRYVEDELSGKGVITYYLDGVPFRLDEKSIFTSYKWKAVEIRNVEEAA